jgi:hypothetical protein
MSAIVAPSANHRGVERAAPATGIQQRGIVVGANAKSMGRAPRSADRIGNLSATSCIQHRNRCLPPRVAERFFAFDAIVQKCVEVARVTDAEDPALHSLVQLAVRDRLSRVGARSSILD